MNCQIHYLSNIFYKYKYEHHLRLFLLLPQNFWSCHFFFLNTRTALIFFLEFISFWNNIINVLQSPHLTPELRIRWNLFDVLYLNIIYTKMLFNYFLKTRNISLFPCELLSIPIPITYMCIFINIIYFHI